MNAVPSAGWLDRLAGRRLAWALVLAGALLARLAFVAMAPAGIPWADGRAYEAAGWALAAEHRYTADFFLPPAYPFFIAGVYSVTGRDLHALRLVEAGLSTATVALIGAFGAALLGPAAGLVAATLAALHPVMAFLPITHYVETLMLSLAVVAFGLYGLALRRPSGGRFVLAGLAYGVALLCKPTLSALLPGLALGTLIHLGRRGALRLARWGALFTLALALVVAPWVARNHAVYGRWFFITAGGGRQFWMGNNPDYRGSTQWNPKPTGALLDSIRALPNYTDQERAFYREGMRFVREQPGRAASLYLVKMRNLWALYPRTQTRTAYSVSVADWAMGAMSVVIFVGALLGLLRVLEAGLGAFPLGIVSFTLTASVFLTVMRYRMSIEPLLLWLAGAGWAALLGARSGRGRAGANPPRTSPRAARAPRPRNARRRLGTPARWA